ncbi:uncharacterized protein DNG_05660 [Cephalotrichum gorgonifer]|uniref:Uncharacterized protein n=1 Tax=Cephalotrichum gorgonifer TaxID=2041049 RepID=A0AAE8N0A0_9PEZI|nr:uncharacterized protein DNG_05660 [Cephalotrichum gorgonifer]
MRGRANKVTKPKRSSRTPSVAPEAVSQGVDYLAAAAHAQQQLGDHHHNHHDHDQLHDPEHEHEHDEGDDEGDEDDQQHQQHQHQQEQDFYQASNAVEQHQRQQLGLEPAEVVPGTADPSIHPDLQAFGSAAHAHFSLSHQDMDAQMQDASVGDPASVAAAAAAAVGSASKPVAGLSTAADFARESGYENLDLDQTASTLSRRLMSQPGRRLALQRRKEQKLNLVRRSNVEALLAHVSGQQAASACKNCHKGHGPWTSCVVVDGQMCGSCANCWYNASGARCSFHETNNPQAHQPAVLPPSAAPQPNAFGLPHLAPANSTIQLPAGVLAHDPQLANLTYDSEAKLVMDRAMAAAREATTRKARHLLKVEVAAKQLVLSMLEYEEYAQSEAASLQQQHSHAQQQQQRLSHAQAQAHAQGAVRQVSESGQAVPDASMGPGEEDDGT